MYFCVWGVCEGVGIYVYMVGMCKEGGNVLGRREKINFTIISYFVTLSSLVHEKKILSHQPGKDD